MGFIAGYYRRNGRHETDRIEETLKRFAILPDENPEDYETIVLEAPYGHTLVKTKKGYPLAYRPITKSDGSHFLSLGFFYDHHSHGEQKALLEAGVNAAAKEIQTVEGEFVSILVDGASGDVHIVNDRFASRPFYLMHTDGAEYYSSNLAFLLHLTSKRPRADILGWLQLFSFQNTIGTRTTFRNIRRLRPSTHLWISPGQIREGQYWICEHNPESNLDPKVAQ